MLWTKPIAMCLSRASDFSVTIHSNSIFIQLGGLNINTTFLKARQRWILIWLFSKMISVVWLGANNFVILTLFVRWKNSFDSQTEGFFPFPKMRWSTILRFISSIPFDAQCLSVWYWASKIMKSKKETCLYIAHIAQNCILYAYTKIVHSNWYGGLLQVHVVVCVCISTYTESVCAFQSYPFPHQLAYTRTSIPPHIT